ncbi:hypothetical protein [Nocardioides sp. Kera G14]|uniref:hypothetical protein n=1 Tax=Nocardioides sp. Kera G14 TaxID=2884264 RepID=UPI001D11D2B5|nr:hypothetical protein [Nocardioides sp. Kera G14]UDY23263.1 hypothetical protein LH076_14515 [Nocardioides sp. Kera G14]
MERMRRWWGMPTTHRPDAVRRQLDEVTGLPRYSPADGSLAASATGSAIVIEVDGYLMTSQIKGFRSAESLLIDAASCVAAVVEPVEGRVRRMTGPQLVVLLPTRDPEMLADLASRLALVDDRPTPAYRTGLTLGYAVSPVGGRDVPALVRSAIVALAHARREGAGSAVAFQEGLADDARERFAFARVSRAAERDVREPSPL